MIPSNVASDLVEPVLVFLFCYGIVNSAFHLFQNLVTMAEESKADKGGDTSPKSLSSIQDNHDTAGMDPIEPIQTNNVRPACFNTTFQEVLFVLTATMAIAMVSSLGSNIYGT